MDKVLLFVETLISLACSLINQSLSVASLPAVEERACFCGFMTGLSLWTEPLFLFIHTHTHKPTRTLLCDCFVPWWINLELEVQKTGWSRPVLAAVSSGTDVPLLSQQRNTEEWPSFLLIPAPRRPLLL